MLLEGEKDDDNHNLQQFVFWWETNKYMIKKLLIKNKNLNVGNNKVGLL